MNRQGIDARFRHGSRLSLVVLLVALGPAQRSPSAQPALEVEYAGCKAVLEPGPVCVLDEKRELRLWVGAPLDARIELKTGGEPLDIAGETVREGQRFSLSVPRTARKVEVVAETAEGRASWFLRFAEPAGDRSQENEVGSSRDVLREVNEKTLGVYRYIRDRNLAAARETLTSLRLSFEAPAESRYLLSFYMTLLTEREGDYRSALAEIQKAVAVAERVKLEREQWLAEQELALLLMGVGRFREAAELFERLRETPHPQNSCEDAELLSNQAWSVLLAREAGEEFSDPTPLLERALETFKTCKRVTPEKRADVLINLALAHLQENRTARAKGFLERAHELEPRPPLPHRLWALALEARIALQEGRPAEALQGFADLHELAAATSSADGMLRASLGEAQSQEALGRPDAALESLGKAEALLDEQSLQIPLHEGRETFMAMRQAVVSLHVELLLGQDRIAEALAVARHGRSRMLRQLERSDRLANLTPEGQAQWANLLIEYHESRTALEEGAKDDWKLLEDQRSQAQEGRKARAEAVKRLLDKAFLLLGDPVRQNGEAPPSPSSGELILAYHPLRRGWVGFAADESTVAVHRFELPPDFLSRPEELARRLLLPFRASIARAKRIRILPSGALRGVDFHALPFEGDILLAKGPVVYGLDLPVSTFGQPSGRHALLVADPREDLPGTLVETRAVRGVLESSPQSWSIEELKNAEASAQAVRDRLPAADLLHYAGHGTFSGFGGWESGLLLAEESRLTLGDLLSLERVPAWVVLSGCDTGLSSTEVPVESLGLAHAFLLAGSRAVAASTRKTDDRMAPAFLADLYRQWNLQTDLDVAFQRAQLAWRQRNPKADWASFRLFEP